MYTSSEVKDGFLETVPESQRSVAANILDIISFQEKRRKRSIIEFDKSDFVNLLNRCLEGGYSKYTFDSRKGLITAFLNYLSDGTQIDSVTNALKNISYEDLSLSTIVEKRFFRDYKTLQYFLEWALEEITRNSESSEEVYDIPICLLLSAWEGIDIDEVVQIKKSHVDIDGQIWLPVSQKFIRPEQETLHHLVSLRDATTYQINGLASKSYIKSEYLFRSYLTPQLTQGKVRSIINAFNRKTSNAIPKCFSYDKVRLSGIYARAHIKETEEYCAEKLISTNTNSRVEVLSMFFDVNFKAIKEATDFTRAYLQWKRFNYK